MSSIIYVKLLDEGVLVYRPVTAIKLAENIYRLESNVDYDPLDEKWEFPPGSKVITSEKELEGTIVLVATKEKKENED